MPAQPPSSAPADARVAHGARAPRPADRRAGHVRAALAAACERYPRLAARLLGTPAALVTCADGDDHWLAAATGFDATNAAAPEAFVGAAVGRQLVAAGAPVVVTDARGDAGPDVGAYLAVPVAAAGATLGGLCVIDARPRGWSDDDVTALADVAAAVAAELELRQARADGARAEREKRLLLDASPDAFVVVDADGRCTYLSERAERRLGRPAAEVIGQPLVDQLPDTERAAAAALQARVRATGEVVESEFLATTPGMPGGRWLSVRAVPVPGGGAAVAMRDVTDRHEADAHLRAREAVLRQFITHTPAAVAMFDRDMRYLAASRRWVTDYGLEAQGLDPASILGRSYYEVFPEVPERWKADHRRVLAGDVLRRPSDQFERADGSVEHLRYELHPWRDDAGRVGGVMMFTEVITTEVALQDALREGEARFRAVVDTASDAVVTADGTGHITYWNAAAERIFGWTQDEALGESLAFILPDGLHARYEAGAARLAPNGLAPNNLAPDAPAPAAGQVLELEARRRSGDAFPVDVAVNSYRVDGAVYYTSIIRDATARRRADAALRGSEARYRALVEQSPEPVYLHRDGCVLYANPAGARLLGYRDGAALEGVSWFAVLHPDDHAAAARDLERLGAGVRQERHLHYRLLRVDDSEVEVEAISAIVHHDGAPAVQTLLRDVSERNRLQRQLAHQAFHDPLTGLANRALFLDRLGHALDRRAAARDGLAAAGAADEAVAVLYLDLDDFKTVNDSLGHAFGDALLQEVAERLRRATRGCDTVARLGGDEFAVLLEGMAGAHDAAVVVERVAAALAAPVRLGDGPSAREVRAGASLGVAHARGRESAEGLLRDADVAMYRAKGAGKGRHAVFEPAMHAALLTRLELEADLRRALDDPAAAGLWVAYQPVVELATGRVRSFEALARWTRPGRDAVSPAEFIPIAEATGLIAPLGRWVLETACADAARWRAARPGAAPAVAVNVSGRQLEECDALAADVRAALERSGLPASALVLEMTESVLMQRTGDTLARLDALKALGVRLAVDDFGTGYSSLAYLQRFPVDILKIDKAFVDGVADEEGDRAIARTVLALAASLGLRVVAEGVERADQRAALAGMGCDFGQGWLFGRPLPAAEARALLG